MEEHSESFDTCALRDRGDFADQTRSIQGTGDGPQWVADLPWARLPAAEDTESCNRARTLPQPSSGTGKSLIQIVLASDSRSDRSLFQFPCGGGELHRA